MSITVAEAGGKNCIWLNKMGAADNLVALILLLTLKKEKDLMKKQYPFPKDSIDSMRFADNEDRNHGTMNSFNQ